jgi:D-beta-D-heptose 7-phosphate kinase/D-beta-D-heptose 1-phosphate adenosyltransferase
VLDHRRKTTQLIDRFKRLKTLVIGDLMLDHYIWGTVSRISPEAPVPVVQVSRETEMPGGAGNVAVNMAALGADVHVVGLLGEDPVADRLLSLFERSSIGTDSIARTPERPTILKTRIIAHHQQVVRVDREIHGEFSSHLSNHIWSHVERLLPTMQAVVLSDYAKGVVTPSLIARLIALARKSNVPIVVDPKVENFRLYKQVTCVTPNTQEAMQSAGVHALRSQKDVEKLGTLLLRKINAESILITRGEHGMSLFEKNKPAYHIPTRAREVFDVTGAGDTVISTLGLALAAGAPLRSAAELANYAAGVVVGKLGTASVSSAELLKAVNQNHG